MAFNFCADDEASIFRSTHCKFGFQVFSYIKRNAKICLSNAIVLKFKMCNGSKMVRKIVTGTSSSALEVVGRTFPGGGAFK